MRYERRLRRYRTYRTKRRPKNLVLLTRSKMLQNCLEPEKWRG